MNDWVSQRFDSFAKIVKGVTYQASDYADASSGVPFITIKCFEKGGGFKKEGLKYYSGPSSPEQNIQPGDLLVALTDLTRDGDIIGSALLVPDGCGTRLLSSMDTAKVIPKSAANPRFLAYRLQMPDVRRHMQCHSGGSTVLHLHGSAFDRLVLPLPPLDEQRRIAAILDASEATIRATEAVIEKLRLERIGVRRDLLLHHSMKVAEKQVALSEMGEWVSGGTPAKGNTAFWNGDVPWLTPKDMKGPVASETTDYITTAGVAAGARLVPIGSVGFVVRGMILAHTFPVCRFDRPMAFNQDIKVIIPSRDVVLPGFLHYWMMASSPRFLALCTESTHGTKKLESSEIGKVKVALPSMRTQEIIVEVLRALDNSVEVEVKHLGKIRLQHQGLLHDLLTGAVRTHA